MDLEIYRDLANRLDAIPNGFPATESGVELRLLARMFAPQEAALAAVMRLTAEPVAEIALRAGIDPEKAAELLEAMAAKGLIGRKWGEARFALHPFVVGIYEAQLPRMDEEMAALFEQYYQESRAGFVQHQLSIHRVIPVGEAIPFELEIFPYEHAATLLENAKSWAVRDCICRVQRRLVGKGCDHPVENCLVFAPAEGVFDNGVVDRPITKTEALRILHEAEESGLVHTAGNFREGNFYICNCCTCCCGILRGVAEFDIPTAVARSDFRAVVNQDLCLGCGDCMMRCQFAALDVPEDVAVVDYLRCVGCGQCILACPSEALSLARRPQGEVPLPPRNDEQWQTLRATERGISLSELQ